MGHIEWRRAARVAAAAVCVCGALAAQAGNLRLDRTRLDLSARETVAEINVENAGAEPTLIQCEVQAWGQAADATDQLVPTQELLVSPPIVEIPAGASQLLRVGLLGSADPGRELTYRLIVQEVPRPEEVQEGAAVRVLLRISLPVFVESAAAVAPALAWRARRSAPGQIELSLANTGTAHVQVTEIALTSPDGAKLAAEDAFIAYVLPGATRTWTLATDVAWSGTRLQLTATTDQGSVSADLDLAEH